MQHNTFKQLTIHFMNHLNLSFSLFLLFPLASLAQVENANDTTKNVELKAAVVEGARVVRHNGYDSYYPTKVQRSNSANGLDLLSKIELPGIHVDQVQKNISNSMGTGNVVVKINNVESTIDQLQAIHPEQITSIELTTAPGMRYGSGVGVVINVKTKRKDYGYAAGINTMNAVLDNYNDDGIWAKYWSGKSEFGLQYNFKLNGIKNAYSQGKENFTFSDGTTKEFTKDGAYKGGNYRGDNITLSYNYSHPAKRMLDIKSSWTYDRFPNRHLIQEVTGAENYSMQTNTQSDEKAYLLKAYYEEKFTDKGSLELNLGLAYLDNAYDRGFTSPWDINTYSVSGDKYAIQANANYSHILSAKSKISFGYNQYSSYTGNKYIGTNNLRTGIHEDSEYAFAEYALSLSKLYLSAGIGGSRSYMSQSDGNFTFYSFRPQVVLQYMISKQWSLMYRYNRNPQSPSLADLTEYTRQDDALQATVGNAGLKPYNTESHLLLANWNKKNTSFRIYGLYEYTHNGIGEVIEEVNGLFMHKNYNNVNHRHIETAIYFGHSLFSRHVSFYIEPKLVYDHSLGYFNNKNTDLSLQAGIDAYYRNWSLSTYYRTAAENLFGDLLVRNCSSSDICLGYRYRSLQAKIGLRNAFRNNGKTYVTENQSPILKSIMSQGNRTFGNMVYVSLSWGIFKGKSTKKAKAKDIQINTDSGIIK